jgi:hypothetical protein
MYIFETASVKELSLELRKKLSSEDLVKNFICMGQRSVKNLVKNAPMVKYFMD